MIRLALRPMILITIAAAATLMPGSSHDGGHASTFMRPQQVKRWGLPVGGYPPCPQNAEDPTHNTLYQRYVDSSGNDFEVWCINNHYEFWASYPATTTNVEIDQCEFITNDVTLTLTAPVTPDITFGPTIGEPWNFIVLTGTITGYEHFNWGHGKDYRDTYDYATKTRIRQHTVYTKEDAFGNPTDDHNVGTPVPTVLKPNQPLPSPRISRTVGMPSVCVAAPHRHPNRWLTGQQLIGVPSGRGLVQRGIVYYIDDTLIRAIRFDARSRTLILALARPPHDTYVSVAIPQIVFDPKRVGLIRAVVDGRVVAVKRRMANRYIVLNFTVSATARVVTIGLRASAGSSG